MILGRLGALIESDLSWLGVLTAGSVNRVGAQLLCSSVLISELPRCANREEFQLIRNADGD